MMWQTVRVPAGLLVVLVSAGLVLERGSRHRDTLQSRALSRVERIVRDELVAQRIPGLAVAVERDGKRWSRGFGQADIENQVPVTPDTVFRLASISKPITAVAVLQLVAQDRIDLDAPIQRYVPSFPEKPWRLTCRQLLAHQGGVRWYRGAEMLSTRHYDRVVDALEQFRDDPLEFEPGTRFLYSSFGYNLLGAAVEGASGKSYLDYVRSHIFGPARMAGARDDDCHALILHRAAGYRRLETGELRNSALSDTSNKLPGGGLCGTVHDIVSFGEAFQHARLLPPAQMRLMMTPQHTRGRVPTGYGLGWHVRHHRERIEVYHAGNQPQVSGLLYLRPESGVTVGLLCNLEGAQLLDLARRIAGEVESYP